MHPAILGLVALLALNVITFGAFWHDKTQARSGGWRVPERTLLLLALLGGWGAAKYAQGALRHKTIKQPFGLLLNLVPLAWVGLAAGLWLAVSYG